MRRKIKPPLSKGDAANAFDKSDHSKTEVALGSSHDAEIAERGEADPLFGQALKTVLENQQASIALMQCRFQREPERITKVLDALRRTWEQNLDLRLGQIAAKPTSPFPKIFYLEDDAFLEGLASSGVPRA